jgi:hypothetical protein
MIGAITRRLLSSARSALPRERVRSLTQHGSGACIAAIEAIYSITWSARTSRLVGNSIPAQRMADSFEDCATDLLMQGPP